MSKRMKVIVSVLVAILLLTVGVTATVMAQEEPTTPAPQAEENGLLARVAEILDISQEDLVNAFKQAREEMQEEAFIKSLDKAVERGLITQKEADKIKGWWEQKPETIRPNLFQRIFGFPALRFRHMWGAHRGWFWARPPIPAD